MKEMIRLEKSKIKHSVPVVSFRKNIKNGYFQSQFFN